MCISNEYRWNVPVVTYGFDQSFMDYFGTNGVAAVESAIQILNNLRPASQIVLTNYPFDSQQLNFEARAQSLYDLKSQTLKLLLEQLGLGYPARNVFVLKQWTSLFAQTASDDGLGTNAWLGQNVWQDWAIPDYIIELNYDPVTLSPTLYVNNTLYVGAIGYWNTPNRILEMYPVDIFGYSYTAVADYDSFDYGGDSFDYGVYYTGLTYDDVGGLAYLLSTKNVNYETLLPGTRGVGRNAHPVVRGVWRPGVDKITFVPQPVNPRTGAFQTYVSRFTDRYFTNGVLAEQEIVRAISQPDFLFSVADLGAGNFETPSFVRTGTTNWINNAAANGNTNGAGPGVIQPPVQIIFNKLGPDFSSDGNISDTEAFEQPQCWASFDGSINPPVIYPISPTGTNQLTVRMWLLWGTYPSWSTSSFEWTRTSAAGAQFTLQTSTDLVDWINLFTVPNNGTVSTFFNNNPASPSRFYRLIP